ncbi:hypothetical protein BDD12DRAFT_344139 [Trichophaea hybrida]|nr:hypothetical protein BDD12DRAFT_344139 [Trichophaea hybrida]
MLDYVCNHLKVHDTSQFSGAPSRREQKLSYYNSPLPDAQGERVRVIMDAIVTIAQPYRRQVLAMTLATNNTEVRLCIAQNDTQVPLSVEKFLLKIWDQLREMSKHHANAMALAKRSWKPLADGSSPKAERGDKRLQELGRNLRREVYQHNYARFKQRVLKRQATFINFRQHFDDNWNPSQDFDIHFHPVLDAAALIVEFVANKQTLDTTSVDDLITKIEALRFLLKNLHDTINILGFDRTEGLQIRLQSDGVFRSWLSTRQDPNKPFPLSRYLYKMLLYEDSIQQLCRFAFSPRLVRTLFSNVTVARPQPQIVMRTSPTVEQLKAVVKSVFNETDFGRNVEPEDLEDPEDAEIVNDVFEKSIATIKLDTVEHSTEPKKNTKTSTHAEWTLLLYHFDQVRSNPSHLIPFSYVAVSKLSCLMCFKAFEGFRRAESEVPMAANRRLRLCLLGCHGKVYHPWTAATDTLNADYSAVVRRVLWQTLVGLYSRFLFEEKRRVRTMSDSTNNSANSQDLGDEGEDTGAVIAELQRKTEEARSKRQAAMVSSASGHP